MRLKWKTRNDPNKLNRVITRLAHGSEFEAPAELNYHDPGHALGDRAPRLEGSVFQPVARVWGVWGPEGGVCEEGHVIYVNPGLL
jgi:hypothetical protein